MAARTVPSRGSKPDKLMRDALIMELQCEEKDASGQMAKRLRLVARKLIYQAMHGNLNAIKEINDRVDGKVAPAPFGDEAGEPLPEQAPLKE